MDKLKKLETLIQPLAYSDEFAKFVDSLPDHYKDLFEIQLNIVDNISYLDIAKEDVNKISYLTFNKLISNDKLIVYKNTFSSRRRYTDISREEFEFDEYFVSYPYEPSHRVMARPGRVFKMLFPNQHNKDIEFLTSKFKAFVLKEYSGNKINANFKLVQGDYIVKYYNQDMYSEDMGGDLHSSCMRSMSKNILEMYVKNSQVKLGILLDEEGLVRARGLVWDDTYFDRVYGVSHSAEVELIAILSSSYKDIWRGKTYVSHSEETKVVIKLDNAKFDYYPFLDSLFLMNIHTNEISNDLSIDPTHCLDGTDGEVTTSETCPGYHVNNCNDLGEYFYNKPCDLCDNNSRPLFRTYEGLDVCEHCVLICNYTDLHSSEGYIRETYNGRFVHETVAVELYNGNWAWEGDRNLIEIDSDWYLFSEVDKSDIDGNYYPKEILDTYSINGIDYYCTESQYEILLEEHEQTTD